jgi:hypothetical protein
MPNSAVDAVLPNDYLLTHLRSGEAPVKAMLEPQKTRRIGLWRGIPLRFNQPSRDSVSALERNRRQSK